MTAPAIPRDWRAGEIAVVGLGKSGRGVARLLAREGLSVYASDASTSDAVRHAAADLAATRVDAQAGGHDLDRIGVASLVVASPGVPPDAPPLVRARLAQVPVVSEIEIALRFLPNTRYIAVTGTNGKTTTTALIGHILRALGHHAVDAGNIGTALSDVALGESHPAWIALEMSSFQLHDTPGIDPEVGVLTNLSPDHLDRYGSVEEYYADKALLFRNARRDSTWVVNRDDPAVTRMVAGVAGARQRFSLVADDGAAWYRRGAAGGGELMVLGEPLLRRQELALFGDHNVANALAAALAVMIADPSHPHRRAEVADGLRSFRPLTHRLESAGEFGGVLWINDSKATNVSSTLVAVKGMTRPTILLLGGRHKGEPYTVLAEPFRGVGKRVLAYGESAPVIEQDLGGLVPLERLSSDFRSVMARARELAEPGDVVLLSPACSSYDMFNNYEERGAEFKRLAADAQ